MHPIEWTPATPFNLDLRRLSIVAACLRAPVFPDPPLRYAIILEQLFKMGYSRSMFVVNDRSGVMVAGSLTSDWSDCNPSLTLPRCLMTQILKDILMLTTNPL